MHDLPLGGSGEPAPLAARVAAFLLDWAAGLGLGILLSISAWCIWLVAGHGGTNQPPDAAIYAGLVIISLALPIWAVVSTICLVRWGQTPGLAAMALRVADESGLPPHPLQALSRVLVLAAGAVATVLSPLLVVTLVSAGLQGTLPPLAGVLLAVPLLLPAAEAVCCLATAERRALHDLAAGTRVVRAAVR